MAKGTIQTIFNIEKSKLNSSQIITVENFLSELSHKFEEGHEINVSYLIEKTREFCEKRALKILFDKGSDLIEVGRISELC